ncbi:homeobox-DDT domain protein RLT2-like isoform X2 [Andrographis paniculata]|uniref:homeobox-DDT domain protein RLT2-like isoform X2 n=1 Tax=Andrographis paniculata TaxID=175694 RepID=UPI0021E930B5|nr:homeobox-DDT domain protein RLT2-like isoform X2 [Andrographis paniculata]
MEVDGSGDADGGGGGAVEMEKKNVAEGEPKVKRRMKTPSQLELLEKTYAVETYPSESLRAELSVKLGLSDRQLQMWFCHRRLKDRKAPPEKKPKKSVSPCAVEGTSSGNANQTVVDNNAAAAPKDRGGLGLFGSVDIQPQQPPPPPPPPRVAHKVGTAVPRISTESPAIRRFYEPPLAISEQRAITFVEAQLGESLREDGPILGMEFDPLPPGAFGAPIVPSNQQNAVGRSYEGQSYERSDSKSSTGGSKALHEYQFLPEKPSVRNDAYGKAVPPHYYGSQIDIHNTRVSLPTGRSVTQSNEPVPSGYSVHSQMPSVSLLTQHGRQSHRSSPAHGEVEFIPGATPLASVGIETHYNAHLVNGMNNLSVTKERRTVNDQERLEKKRKSEEARIAKEVEAHEKRIRKELEKQDMLRRKREEQLRKEMERQDRERRREEERILREKQREEERYQREQRREMERREKFLQKEYIKAEKMRLKEELRKEKVAARLKAANERAVARRIAKESMELIDDERLELMEIAALTKGLSSVSALDSDALQNLDSFKDKLPEFPQKSVNLKSPFGVEPWNNSEENVGNLLMVWRFLITFSDVLDLWPFTLDEFTQALHDCDPRLLGEIHIALLRSILKDIEDVARTPNTALAANQNLVALPGGGHLQIVAGAHAWGFDLASWKSHLTPLTWPEVLRQISLAAGFGPKLKKPNDGKPYLHDDHESDDGKDAVSRLRSGAAAENAVVIMQERGLSNPRRSRHRLTPGTVKYAAFHVLSLEGSRGLSILDVAHKIQKSGLRDLTTSKTPEASISAALSRDTKLFERTAPSTYCVRSPYRKDSGDADAVLSSAREKIRIYQNANLDGETEDAEKEDAERDQDSESDTADDPDVDDLDAIAKLNEDTHSSEQRIEDQNFSMHGKDNSCNEFIENPVDNPETPNNILKQSVGHITPDVDDMDVITKNKEDSHSSEGRTENQSCSAYGKVNSYNEVVETPSISFKPSVSNMECNGTSGDPYEGNTGIDTRIGFTDQEDNVINECGLGEPWVQGLTEGEYPDLSIEERLNILVALISIVNEGNSMRVVLEERLEAANALKKQMWAEAKLDKRRIKEENALKLHHSSAAFDRTEHPSFGTFEDKQNTLNCDIKNSLSSSSHALQMVDLNEQQNEQSCCNDGSEKTRLVQEFSVGSDNLLVQQSAYNSEKSRSVLKALIGHQAEEMCVYRSLPLGLDRRRNRYWQFITSPSRNDPGTGRIFVELCNGGWRLIDSEEDFDTLTSSLDIRGVREYHLHLMLQRIEVSFKEAARKNSYKLREQLHDDQKDKGFLPLRPKPEKQLGNDTQKPYMTSPDITASYSFVVNVRGENEHVNRYKDAERWMWDECFDSNRLNAVKSGRLRCQLLLEICNWCRDLFTCDDSHCPFCHRTYSTSDGSFDFSQHVSRCNGKLSEEPDQITMNLSLSPRFRLLKAQLAMVEASIPYEAFECVWSDECRRSWGMELHRASTAEELLRILTMLENSVKRDFISDNYETTAEMLGFTKDVVIPWIPTTTSAVALRLMELDSSIYYTLRQKDTRQDANEAGKSSRLRPSHDAIGGVTDNTPQGDWVDLLSVQANVKRGRGRPRGPTRARGGKSARKSINSYDESAHGTTSSNKFGELPGWKGRPRGQGGRRKGRRSIRSRQKPAEGRAGKNIAAQSGAKGSSFDNAPDIGQEEWNMDETPAEVAEAKNGSSSERSEFYEDNSQASGDEYDDLSMDYCGERNEKFAHLAGGSDNYKAGTDVDDNDEAEGDGEEEEREQEQEGDFYVDGFITDRDFEEGNQLSGGGQVRNVNRVSDAGSLRSLSSSSSSDYSY